jgi:hypothetical protein
VVGGVSGRQGRPRRSDRASQTVAGTFGEQSFESLVGRLLCADTLVHTWDLARAAGQEEQLDPDAVVKAMEFLAPLDEAIRRPWTPLPSRRSWRPTLTTPQKASP